MITDMKQYGLTDRILALASMYPELTVGRIVSQEKGMYFVELAAITDCFSTSEFLKYPPELFVSQKHFSKKHREILSEEQ